VISSILYIFPLLDYDICTLYCVLSMIGSNPIALSLMKSVLASPSSHWLFQLSSTGGSCKGSPTASCAASQGKKKVHIDHNERVRLVPFSRTQTGPVAAWKAAIKFFRLNWVSQARDPPRYERE